MDYLGTAQGLARRLPAEHRIKLHRRLCLRLQKKLNKTLEKIVDSCRSDGGSECYREVLKELHRVVQKVKTFVDECCFDDDGKFTLAALRVTAHKERYFMYRVELHWCMFLVECVRDGYVHGERQFDWEIQKSTVVRKDSSMIEDDEKHLKALLKLRIEEPGEHQAICWNLLRRLEAGSESYNILPGDLGMPPIMSRRGRCVGRGGYGSVYEVNWEGKTFAVKEFEDTSTCNEVKILGDCCHPHIVNLVLAHSQDGNQYLMMEKLSMDLHSYIEERKSKGERFSALEVVDMISQVCEGMLYLNDTKSVSHRDVKPRNILVKESPYHPDDLDRLIGENRVTELQVADFGLAKVRENLDGKYSASENTPNKGTPLYRAPELIQKPGGPKIRMSSTKADIYSFAVTCSCLLTGTEPSGSNESVRLGQRPALPSDCPPGLSSLLQRCWHQKPSERPKDFKQIRMELRKLKTDLLTAHAQKNRRTELTKFNNGDRPLRVLALSSDSRLVELAVNKFCGARSGAVKVHMNLTESSSSSPPISIYYSDTRGSESYSFSDIKSFVKSRNSRWQQKQVEGSWKEYLHHMRSTSFPDNGCSRLHMVWYLCEKISDLPNKFHWDSITEELCGLPVQVLVLGTNQPSDLSEYNEIVNLGSRLFPNRQFNLEELIVRVDTTDQATLWRACSAVKTQAEIENAATVIAWIREKLGPSGLDIRLGVGGAKILKPVSLSRSGKLVLDFLCTYWDFPEDAVHGVLQRMTTFEPQPGKKTIRIKPHEFVTFCLQVAAIILYSSSNPACVHSWIPVESLEKEAEACYKIHFPASVGPSDYDQMTSTNIQAFLQSVFERKNRVPTSPSFVGVERRNTICSKLLKLLSSRSR